MSTKLKLAYGSVPKDSGTFTFYRHLRQALTESGIEVFCVSVGKQEAALWNDSFADDHCVLLAPEVADRKKQTQAFVNWTHRENIDLVMPINSVALLSALPHLEPRTRVVMRCANAFDHGYRITVACPDRTSRIVATTPRHVNDLTASYGVDPGKITLIPHGIDPSPFGTAAANTRGAGSKVSLGFMGRIEHNQKGVFYLPGIVAALSAAHVSFDLQIAGEGEHRSRLGQLLQPWIADGTVNFLGGLTPAEVPGFLGARDIFLFPSRFEGFGFSLVEAMMAGCVPVASQIEGITDFIIEHERTGLLCPIGDEKHFAALVGQLAGDRALLEQMGKAAAQAAQERFTRKRMGADYARLFGEVMMDRSPRPAPQPWSEFRVDANFATTWRHFIPRPLKKLLRRLPRLHPRRLSTHRSSAPAAFPASP